MNVAFSPTKHGFNLKLLDGHPNSPLPTWGALAWGSTVWWCFKNSFLVFMPPLNLLESLLFSS